MFTIKENGNDRLDMVLNRKLNEQDMKVALDEFMKNQNISKMERYSMKCMILSFRL